MHDIGSASSRARSGSSTQERPRWSPIGVDVAPDVDAATWTNTAAASSTTPDLVPGNNTSTVGGALAPIADLRLTKVADRSSVRVGETISWTIGFENLGPSTARDVIVVDALPAGLTTVVTAGDGTCDPLAGTSLTCRWASVEVSVDGHGHDHRHVAIRDRLARQHGVGVFGGRGP